MTKGNWPLDLFEMHQKFEFHTRVNELNPQQLAALLVFRVDFLEEELEETKQAVLMGDKDEIVDGLIDLCVVALGTLDLFRVDAQEAWNRVHAANMAKVRGNNSNRPNPLGLPDLTKPEGWTAPTHVDNTGLLGAVDYREVISICEAD